MAIDVGELRQDLTGQDRLPLEIYNGELAALNEIMRKWKFKDYKAALQFAIAVLTKAETPQVSIFEKGRQVRFSPSKEILRKDENAEEEDDDEFISA